MIYSLWLSMEIDDAGIITSKRDLEDPDYYIKNMVRRTMDESGEVRTLERRLKERVYLLVKKRRAADNAARAGSRQRTTIKSGLETAKFGRRSISLGWEWG